MIGNTPCLFRFRELLVAVKQCAGHRELPLEQSAENGTIPARREIAP